MRIRKIIFSVALCLFGAIIGWMVNSATLGKYNTINATCTLLNTAVDQQMLRADQVMPLGQATQKHLTGTAAGAAFQISEQQIQSAAKGSNCSQFMVGMSMQ